jgi:hypothetical protein
MAERPEELAAPMGKRAKNNEIKNREAQEEDSLHQILLL